LNDTHGDPGKPPSPYGPNCEAELIAGAHGSARAGAPEATLEDGRSFSAGDIRTEGAFKLVIDRAGTNGVDTSVFYVTGSLEASLKNDRDTSSKARFRARINRPDWPATD
jgi:hypothetical protein